MHVSLFCVTILFFPEFLKNLKILKGKNYFLSTYLKTAEQYDIYLNGSMIVINTASCEYFLDNFDISSLFSDTLNYERRNA